MQSWISEFVSSLIPPKKNLDEAMRQSNYLIEQLENRISEEYRIEIRRVIIGGSNATHTTIRKNRYDSQFDVDIVFYLNAWRDDWREYIRRELIRIYPNKDSQDFKYTNSSIEIFFHNSNLKIDVVPVICQDKCNNNGEWYGTLIRRDGEEVITSVPKYIEWVRGKTADSNSPVKFNRVIRLVKWWAKVHELDNISSFALTCLTGRSFEQNRFPGTWYPALKQVFNYYHDTWTVIPDLETPVRVRDPINPDNNAADSWSSQDLEDLKRTAQWSISVLDKAYLEYQNGNKIGALDYLDELFGKEFGTEIR